MSMNLYRYLTTFLFLLFIIGCSQPNKISIIEEIEKNHDKIESYHLVKNELAAAVFFAEYEYYYSYLFYDDELVNVTKLDIHSPEKINWNYSETENTNLLIGLIRRGDFTGKIQLEHNIISPTLIHKEDYVFFYYLNEEPLNLPIIFVE